MRLFFYLLPFPVSFGPHDPTQYGSEHNVESGSQGGEQQVHLAHLAHQSLAFLLPIWFSTKAWYRRQFQEFRLIHIRSHYQILFVKTFTSLIHWYIHFYWTNKLLFGQLRSGSPSVTGLSPTWLYLISLFHSRIQSSELSPSVWKPIMNLSWFYLPLPWLASLSLWFPSNLVTFLSCLFFLICPFLDIHTGNFLTETVSWDPVPANGLVLLWKGASLLPPHPLLPRKPASVFSAYSGVDFSGNCCSEKGPEKTAPHPLYLINLKGICVQTQCSSFSMHIFPWPMVSLLLCWPWGLEMNQTQSLPSTAHCSNECLPFARNSIRHLQIISLVYTKEKALFVFTVDDTEAGRG